MRLLPLALLAACSSPPPPPAQVCVARHAESFGNLTERPADLSPEQLDTLTPNGEAQARAAGAKLPDGVVNLWTSPRERAKQTAAAYGLSVTPKIDIDLRPIDGEISWNEWGRAWALGEEPSPAEVENLVDGVARAKTVLGKARAFTDAGETTVIVTHSDLAALLLGELHKLPLMDRFYIYKLETAEIVCGPL